MTTRTKSLAVTAGLAVATLFGVGPAQGEDGDETGGNTSDAVELDGSDELELTPEQMTTKAKKILEDVSKADARVSRVLAQAREEKDIVKVVCVDDKASQISTANSTVQDRNTAMEEAFRRGSVDRGRHEYALIVVLADRVLVLVSEANQCIGEETGFGGEFAVDIEVDPTLPNDDPNLIPYLPLLAIEPTIQSGVD